MEFISVESAEDVLLDSVRQMFEDYARELGVDLCFQGFQQELEELPGKYAPPRGCLLLLRVDGEIAGCGAFRDLGENVVELKRIYVVPSYRGKGLGKVITQELIRRSEIAGYRIVRLDTLRRLAPALALYESLGFVEIEAYNFNPEPDIVYLERSL